MRKFLCIVALSIVAVLAFQSGAVAQYEDPGADDDQYDEDTVQTSGLDGPCAAAAEQLAASRPNVSAETIEAYLNYLPDVGGCVSFEGNTFISSLSVPVYDAETGEELGIVKDLDSDLTSGEFSVTYEEFCGAFPTIEAEGISYAGLTAQEYFDREANDKERAILDPNGDGLACTSDDGAFLAGGGEYEPEFQLEDTWTGIVTQTNPDGEILEYEIEVAMIPLFYITDSMIGDVVAEVSYPTVGCSGVWVLDGFNGGEIMVEERVTTGRENCLDTPVTLTPRDDGSLDYYFLGSTGNVGECVLSLQNTPDDDPLLPSEILRQMGINELPDTGGASSPPVGALLSATGISETVAARRRI